MSEVCESELRAALRSESENWKRLGRTNPRLLLETVLAAGVDCIAQPLPLRFRRRAMKFCFANAISLARLPSGRLTYCEGYAVRPDIGLRAHHAWVIDAERRVVDPTWDRPETCSYLGVPIDLDTYKLVTTGDGEGASVFDSGRGLRLDFMLQLNPGLADLMKEIL